MMIDPIPGTSTDVPNATTGTAAADPQDVQAFEQAMGTEAAADAAVRAQIEAGIRKQVMQQIVRDTFKKPGKVFSRG